MSKQGPRAILTNPTTNDPLLGQATMAASLPFALASDQPPVGVAQADISINTNLTAVAATLELVTTNKAQAAFQIVGPFVATLQFEASVDGINWVSMLVFPTDGSPGVTSTTAPGTWRMACGGMTKVRLRVSAFTSGNAQSFINASVNASLVRSGPTPGPSTVAQTTVGGTVVAGTILAANTLRKGATVFNESTANLFLRLGAPVSLTNYTVRLVPQAYYEVPFSYVGVIGGVWSAATGNARITELT